MMQDDYPGYALPPIEPTAGAIANATATIVENLHDLKQGIKAGLDRTMAQTGAAAQIVLGDVLTWVEETLGDACAVERHCQDAIRAYLQSHLDACTGCAEMLNARIRVEQNKLDRKRQKQEKRIADRERRRLGITEPQTLPDGIDATLPPGGEDSLPPGFTSPPSIWPNPPTQDELQGLQIATDGSAPPIVLLALPGIFWESQNENRLWLSIEPTPVSRGVIPVQRITGGNASDAGVIYLNVSMNASEAALQGMLASLGLGPDRSAIWTPEQAFTIAAQLFGQFLVEQVWRAYSMELPVRQFNQIPPLDEYRRDHPPELAVETPDFVPGGPKLPQETFTRLETPEPPGEPLEPVVLPVRPRADIDFGAFTLDWLTRQRICDFLRPIVGYVGVDIAKFPPCMPYDEFMREIHRKWS
jgi:hypothetical protein